MVFTKLRNYKTRKWNLRSFFGVVGFFFFPFQPCHHLYLWWVIPKRKKKRNQFEIFFFWKAWRMPFRLFRETCRQATLLGTIGPSIVVAFSWRNELLSFEWAFLLAWDFHWQNIGMICVKMSSSLKSCSQLPEICFWFTVYLCIIKGQRILYSCNYVL